MEEKSIWLSKKHCTKPVTVNLLSANHKISNMIFSLNFYQKDAVGANREAAAYQVYFTDENGRQISDVQKIIADKTSDNGAERTFRCQFNLKSLKYSNTAIQLLIIWSLQTNRDCRCRSVSHSRLTSLLRWMSLISLVKYCRRVERWGNLQRAKVPVKK